jgi:hypothetical protein
MKQNPLDRSLPVWRDETGKPISCTEKIKVLNENFQEIRQTALDAMQDGVLMGCCESQLRGELQNLIASLKTGFNS